MRILIISIFLISFLTSTSQAQNFELNMGMSLRASNPNIHWNKQVIVDENEFDLGFVPYDFFIGFTAQAYEDFFIKTKLSSNDYRDVLSIEWQEDGHTKSSFGLVEINQVSFDIIGEYRKSISEKISFTISTGPTLSREIRINSKTVLSSPNRFGFVGNIGLNYMMTDYIGLCVEGEYRQDYWARSSPSKPGFSIKKRGVNVSVVYRLGSTRTEGEEEL